MKLMDIVNGEHELELNLMVAEIRETIQDLKRNDFSDEEIKIYYEETPRFNVVGADRAYALIKEQNPEIHIKEIADSSAKSVGCEIDDFEDLELVMNYFYYSLVIDQLNMEV